MCYVSDGTVPSKRAAIQMHLFSFPYKNDVALTAWGTGRDMYHNLVFSTLLDVEYTEGFRDKILVCCHLNNYYNDRYQISRHRCISTSRRRVAATNYPRLALPPMGAFRAARGDPPDTSPTHFADGGTERLDKLHHRRGERRRA